MALMNFLKERRSVREFKDKELKADDISNVNNAIEEIERNFQWNDIKLELDTDGDVIYHVLDGKAGYSGVMIKSPAYIMMRYGHEDKINKIRGAFVMGELISKLVDLNVGSCVITLDKSLVAEKEELFGIEGNNVDYLIAVGYPEARKPFNPEATSFRYAVEEIAFTDEKLERPAREKLNQLNMLDLFNTLRYTPSYKNKQPWKFRIGDGEIFVYVKNDEDLDHSLTDVGIIMYYFQEMAASMGIKNNWEIAEDLDLGADYIKLGKFKI